MTGASTGRARIWLSAAASAARESSVGWVPPGDEPAGADEDGAVAGDLAMAQPGAARVVEVTVQVADPHRADGKMRRCRELPGRFAPRLAVLAGDQREAPRGDEVLDRAAVAVLVVDPGVRQGAPGRVDGWYTRTSSAGASAALPSGTTAEDW
jgi:hypothetical protein